MASNPPTQIVFAPGRTPYTSLQTLADGINYWNGSPRSGQPRTPFAVLKQTVVQSIANNTTAAVLLDAEDIDTDGGHSTTTNTSRYTAQTAMWYDVRGVALFAANGTGVRQGMLRVNGTDYYGENAPGVASAFETAMPTSAFIFLNVGDYVELVGFQTSTVSLNTTLGRHGSRLAVRGISL